MVRKLGPRLHRIGSLYPMEYVVKNNSVQENLFCLQSETISSTGSNLSTVPNSPSDSATIVGSPISTRASSPFEIEFNDTKSQTTTTTDYFSEFTTLFSKSSPTSTLSESLNSSITTPDYYYSTNPNLSTPCNNKYNLSSVGSQKTNKRKSSAKKDTHQLQYEQIIEFNDKIKPIKPNDVISEEPITNSGMVSNVKSEYTFVEESFGLMNSSIYMQENPGQTIGETNFWEMPQYLSYNSHYNLPNGPLKHGRSGDVFLTDWNDLDSVLDP
ncbi:9228_t:CDS:2 [Funneliformis geosporum]|uniref:8964_t:CDS:1 n=1 Tax=Funneliformis geosporum TaxID=1117311 RepID=A0A9W4SZD6_9GLOM|nr:9228_t:CDS:2 [Funneliformis geosporum]CAI2186905.1 8964_t:CDS:2 [Funneliformis geosporum]